MMRFQATSIYNAPFNVELEINPEWHSYWLNEGNPFGLYQAISDAIINKPYADLPDYLIPFKNEIIYHPNHDTSHAIRQSVNTQYFLSLIRTHGTAQVKATANLLTVEELEALKLAGFLFRAARTNELGGEHDPQNAVRSAELFKAIALEIGFESGLVESFYYCIAYTYTYPPDMDTSRVHEGFNGEVETRLEKLNVIKRLLHLSHHTDLVRCFHDEHVAKANMENLAVLVQPESVEAINEITLEYARASCETTGTPYHIRHTEQAEYPPLYLKLNAIHQVKSVYVRLQELSQTFVSCTLNNDVHKAIELVMDCQHARVHSQPLSTADEPLDAISTHLAHAFFARRAHRITEQTVGISPSKISEENLKKLRQTLKLGEGLSKEDLQRKGNDVLLAEEKPLYDYLVNTFDWTIKHITLNYHSIYQGGNILKSLHQRSREGQINDQRHTSDKDGRSDGIFFSIGGPNSPPTDFLKTVNGHIISIPLRAFLNPTSKKLTKQLSQLWISSAWYGFESQRHLKNTIDTTQRDVKYHQSDIASPFLQKNDKKIYTYKRLNGEVLRREVPFADETVTGAELLPFLAYNLIQELRMVGGDLRKECLSTLSPILIETMVSAIHEANNFEVLIPSRVDLNHSNIRVERLNRVQGTLEQRQRMLNALNHPKSPESALQALLEEGVSVDLNLTSNVTPLAHCILNYSNKYLPCIRYLIQQGADIRFRTAGGVSLLNHAIRARHYPVVRLLLEPEAINQQEQRIQRFIDIHYDLNAIASAFRLHDQEMLQLLQQFGFRFCYTPPSLFLFMTQLPELAALGTLDFIKKAGFNSAFVSSWPEEQHYYILKSVIETSKSELLEALLKLGVNPKATIAGAKHLLTIAQDLQQTKIPQLLEQYGASVPMIVQEEEKLKHVSLLVTNDNQQLLLAKYRKKDGSIAPDLQSITFKTTYLDEKVIRKSLFKASRIRADHFDYFQLPDVPCENEGLVIVKVQLIGKLSHPTATDEWAELQWMDMATARDNLRVDCLTREYAKGAPDKRLLTLLHHQGMLTHAIADQNLSYTQYLLAEGVSDTKHLALMKACDSHSTNLEIVSALIHAGYDVNAVFDSGEQLLTPLMLAIIHNNLALIEFLLQNGGRVNQTLEGISPLLLAAELNQINTLTMLQAHGATYAHPANRGILAWACINNCSDEMFNYLVEQVDIEEQKDNATPLFIVAWKHNLHRMEALLKKGANTKIFHPETDQLFEKCIGDEEKKLLYRYNKKQLFEQSQQASTTFRYLTLTGKVNAPDLQERIFDEYHLSHPQNSTPLAAFFEQLIATVNPTINELRLVIAHSGDAPVFICHGLDKPTIAIHKDLLLDSNLDHAQLCFAITHECALIRSLGHHGITQYFPADQIRADIDAINACPNPDLRLQYLQMSIEFCKSHQAKGNFYWPMQDGFGSDLRRSWLGKYAFFSERIKALRSEQANNPVNAPHHRRRLDNIITHAVHELQPKLYYADFPNNGTPEEQYDYLLGQLESLQDELFPFDLSQIPSLRLKEFGALLHAVTVHEEKRDHLIRKAHDLQLRAFTYIYKSACQSDVWISSQVESESKISPLGYFKDFREAMLSLRSALTREAANTAALEIVTLYPKIKAHGHFAQRPYEYIFDYEQQYPGQLTMTLPFTTDLGDLIEWPDFSNPESYRKHFRWVGQNSQDFSYLWKALWIMGIVTERSLYDHMPRKALLKLPEAELSSAIDDQEIPVPFFEIMQFIYPSQLMEHIYPHFALSKLDTSMLKGNFIEELHDFVEVNFAQLSSNFYSDKHDRPAVHRLLSEFSTLAKGTIKEQRFVHDFFLTNKFPFFVQKVLHCPIDSLFVQFVLKNCHLFTLSEIYMVMNNLYADRDHLEYKTWLTVFCPDKDRVNLSVLLAATTFFGSAPINNTMVTKPLFEAYVEKQGALNLFCPNTYALFDYLLNTSLYHNAKSICMHTLLSSLVWQPLSECHLDIFQTILLYRVFDAKFKFPSLEVRAQWGEHILAKIQQLKQPLLQIKGLESLLFTSNSYRHLALQDRELFYQAAQLWTEAQLASCGRDDSSIRYAHKMKKILDKTHTDAASLDVVYLFSHLANRIEAQQTVCAHIKSLISPDRSHHELKQKINNYSYLIVLFSTLGKEQADKKAMLAFISSELSQTSITVLSHYLLAHPRKREFFKALEVSEYSDKTVNPELNYVLPSLHQIFWGLPLKERALTLDSLLITATAETNPKVHQEAYELGFQYIVKKLLPNADTNEREALALAFLTTYLEEADNYERQFLLAGLLSANQESQNSVSSIGKKLSLLMENLGPAYIKIGQALHSHPDTPADIKADLAHTKGHANPPYRWDLLSLIKRVLPREELGGIVHIGELLGSASYNLAIKVTMSNGQKQILLLLRDKAADDAQKGFAHLRRAVDRCPHPFFERNRLTFQSIIGEADELSHVELDHKAGDQQHQLARHYYSGKTVANSVANTNYEVRFMACENKTSGPGYRRLSLVNGTVFNELPNDLIEDKTIRKAVALAIMEVELALIFSGQSFDCDRHGEQCKIEAQGSNIHVGLYDFGEMSLAPLTGQEINSLSQLVYQLPLAIKEGRSITDLFQSQIEKAIREGEPYRHFIRVNKAFLALQDIQQDLSQDELKQIFKKVLPNMHPQIRNAFKTGAYQIMDFWGKGIAIAQELSQSFYNLFRHSKKNDEEQSKQVKLVPSSQQK